MIYITGDMHGDFSRFKDVKKAHVKKGDTLIVCGDFGFLWNGGKKEEAALHKIGKLPYTVPNRLTSSCITIVTGN